MVRPAQKRHVPGFSLPELMAVLIVLGVLSALAMPRMGRRQRDDASLGLTREVYTRLMQARFAAVSSGGQVEVLLRPGQRSRVLQVLPARQPGMAPLPPDAFGPVTDEVGGRNAAQLVGVAAGVDGAGPPRASTAAAALLFFPDGSAQLADNANAPAGGATVYVADDVGGHPHRVTVFGRTGMPRVLDF